MNCYKLVLVSLIALCCFLPVGCGKAEADKQPKISGPIDPNDKPEGRGGPQGGAAGKGGPAAGGGINKN